MSITHQKSRVTFRLLLHHSELERYRLLLSNRNSQPLITEKYKMCRIIGGHITGFMHGGNLELKPYEVLTRCNMLQLQTYIR